MVSQGIWVAIAVGVFFVGLGVGYAIFQSYNQPNYTMMTPQQMQQMMNNPQTMNQWHQYMMQNPQTMSQWMGDMMNNPQFMNQWHQTMMNNPQAFNSWMGQMMNDPQFMNQWMGTMMQDPNFQQQYMGPWMMMRDPQFMQNMRGQWFDQSTMAKSAVETNKISILADTWQYMSTKAFSPYVIKVSPGTKVTWTNDDTIIHTVTDLAGKFDSGFIQAGNSWEYSFSSTGNYYYFCSIHPWMRGAVIVS